jgi:hypothetical protein
MANKKKKTITLESSAQIDGKAQGSAPEHLYGSLDQILGENISVYKTSNIDEYRSQIADMNQTDLQTHALKIGLIPIEDRRILVGRLVQEFERWHSRMMPQGNIKGSKNINDIDEKARKILREGA